MQKGLKKRRTIRIALLLGVALLGWLHTGAAVDLKKVLSPPVQEKAGAPHSHPHVEVTDIVAFSSRLTQLYFNLKNPVEPPFQLEKIRKHLAAVTKDIRFLAREIKLFRDLSRSSYHQFRYLEGELIRREAQLALLNDRLKRAVNGIIRERSDWNYRKRELQQWRKTAWKTSIPPIERRAYEQAIKTVNDALCLLNERLAPLLAEQEKISALQLRLREFVTIADRHLKALKGNIYERGIPLVFVREFFSQFNRKLLRQGLDEIGVFVSQQGRHGLDNFWIFLGVVLFTFILAFFIRRTGKGLGEFSVWHVFADRPIATALFVCLNLFWFFLSPMPPGWYPAFQFAIVVTVIYLSRAFFEETWKWRTLYRLGVLILIVSLFGMVVVPWPFLQLAVSLVAAFGIYFCFKESFRRKKTESDLFLLLALRLGSVLLSVVLVAELAGYAHLALYLIDAFLLTVFAFLETWMLYLVTIGLIEMMLNRLPFTLIRDNRPVILARIRPLLVSLFTGLLIIVCLVTWEVFPTREEALRYLFSMGFSVGALKVSLGILLMAAAVLYGSFLISWTIQALLLQEILPRRQMSQGVRISITRLVHYGIILVGFLLTLRTLGFGLTNLTIIGGALGVGIGFGLQAIVNNFASGLILLFERPIKVGDTVQIGDVMAVVKRLGLRSTVVQTLDNAEIVIPNSSLVTEKVTNWTLANRRVRVRIPVGVAYGSDIAKVTEILLKCANDQKSVLKFPKPEALFLEFGDSSLNFELRVWIDEFLESTGEIQDSLNRAINQAFEEAGIEIPFPQQDLHLRSVDVEAAHALHDKKTETSDKKF